PVLADLAVAVRAGGQLECLGDRRAVLAHQLGQVALAEHELGRPRAVQWRLALPQQALHVVAADRVALLALPDREPAAGLLLALVRRAAEGGPVLADLAVAAGARAQRRLPQVTEVVDDLLGELGDVAHEPRPLVLAVLDRRQPLLPAARELGGRQRVAAQQLDRLAALRRRDQGLRLPLDVPDVEQPLDRVGAGGGRAQAALLHRLPQLLVVDQLAGRLHRAQQRGLGEAGRWLGLLGQHLGGGAAALLALVDLRQQLLALVLIAAVGLDRLVA